MTFYLPKIGQLLGSDSLTTGEMAEWSNAVVLKTIEPKGSGGSNPSLSATLHKPVINPDRWMFELLVIYMG